MKTGLMSGKRGLVMGVANDHSIAWGIAKALAGEGAELAFTFQNDALGKRVAPLAEELGSADRLYRWLVAGSVLELLIAVPSHIIVNRRHDCTAPFVSSFGVATGLAMLLMSIGPGALFLYRARMRRIGAARRAGGGPS